MLFAIFNAEVGDTDQWQVEQQIGMLNGGRVPGSWNICANRWLRFLESRVEKTEFQCLCMYACVYNSTKSGNWIYASWFVEQSLQCNSPNARMLCKLESSYRGWIYIYIV